MLDFRKAGQRQLDVKLAKWLASFPFFFLPPALQIIGVYMHYLGPDLPPGTVRAHVSDAEFPGLQQSVPRLPAHLRAKFPTNTDIVAHGISSFLYAQDSGCEGCS